MINIASDDNHSDYEKKDEKQAIIWLTKAAKQGDAHAQIQLGKSYRAGWSADRNLKQAVLLITKAVEQRYDEAKEELNRLEEIIRNKRVLSMGRTEVFISYAEEDKDIIDQMSPFLKHLERDNISIFYYHGKLKAGDMVDDEIRQRMKITRVAVFMVSQAFLDSDYILSVELPELLQAAKDGQATILWIPVSIARVKDTWITLPDGEKVRINKYWAVCNSAKTLRSMTSSEKRREIYNKLYDDIKRCFNI